MSRTHDSGVVLKLVPCRFAGMISFGLSPLELMRSTIGGVVRLYICLYVYICPWIRYVSPTMGRGRCRHN